MKTMSGSVKRLLAAATIWGAALSTAQASLIAYEANLGPESPGATGTGSVELIFDTVTNYLDIDADWTGLSGTTTVAHIHCCTASPSAGTVGVAVTPVTLPGFPAGVTSGTYSAIIDLNLAASFTTNFVNNFGGGTLPGARNALLAGLDAGRAYFNIHTQSFPGGEIRGFLQPVPTPPTLALVVLGIAGIGWSRRRLVGSA
jgi:hypothetical protein